MSIKQLAYDLGISVSTVSKALNGYSDVSQETVKRVNKAAKRMGYRPNPAARKLVTGKSKTIGIVLPLPKTDFIDPFFSTLLAGASHRLLESDYLLSATAIPTGDKEADRYERFLEHGHFDGLILMRTRYQDTRIERLFSTGIPFVCYGRTEHADRFAWLDMDNEEAFFMAVKRLIYEGHTKIAILNANEKLYFARLRKDGAKKAFAMLNRPFPTNLYKVTEINEQVARETMSSLLIEDPTITAVLCSSDTQAIGAMAAIKKTGKQPGFDVAVIGCDNNPQGEFCDPPLTSIQHGSVMGIGCKLAEMMLKRIAGTPISDLQVLMKPQWVNRESGCKCQNTR